MNVHQILFIMSILAICYIPIYKAETQPDGCDCQFVYFTNTGSAYTYIGPSVNGVDDNGNPASATNGTIGDDYGFGYCTDKGCSSGVLYDGAGTLADGGAAVVGAYVLCYDTAPSNAAYVPCYTFCCVAPIGD